MRLGGWVGVGGGGDIVDNERIYTATLSIIAFKHSKSLRTTNPRTVYRGVGVGKGGGARGLYTYNQENKTLRIPRVMLSKMCFINASVYVFPPVLVCRIHHVCFQSSLASI